MLAIVIPAYKEEYLEFALESIACQTDKRFHVYIGDDASPANLYQIVRKFEDKISITYTRFENNLGGVSLVAHWHRCIALTQKEEWLWLFSDDDIMQPECVESFYNTLASTAAKYDLYKFNTTVIDKHGQRLRKRENFFPEVLRSQDFILSRLVWGHESYVVEYIFKRVRFEQLGGFPDFETALASDDAFWALISIEKGIKAIPSAFVYWRNSGQNISSLKTDAPKKIRGAMQYMSWLIYKYPLGMAIRRELQVSWLTGIILYFYGNYRLGWMLRYFIFETTLPIMFKIVCLEQIIRIRSVSFKKKLFKKFKR